MSSRLATAWLFGYTLQMLVVGAALAAPIDHCVTVLQYTGREERFVRSLSIEESFREYASDQAADLGLEVDDLALDFSQDSSQEWSMSNYWKDEYFSQSDLVFGPAVKAWLSCVRALKEASLKVEAQVLDGGERLDLTITPAALESRLIQGVLIPTGVDCSPIGDPITIGPTMNHDLDAGKILQISCKREDGVTRAKTVSVVAAKRAFHFQLPPVEQARRPYPGSGGKPLARIAGRQPCEKSVFREPVPYARQLKINGTVYGDFIGDGRAPEANSATLEVVISGKSALSAVRGYDDEVGRRGALETGDFYHWVQAFEPVLIYAKGGIGPSGTCENFTLEVLEP